jgi:hypothetical protein
LSFNKTKICSVEDCENEPKSKGYCLMHTHYVCKKIGDYSKRGYFGSHPYRCRNCEVNYTLKQHELFENKSRCPCCGKNLAIKNKNRSSNPRLVKINPICSFEDCKNKTHGHGYCSIHNRRFKLYGDPKEYSPSKQPEICTIKGCEKKPIGKGYCSMHYMRIRRQGDPNVVLQKKGDPPANRLCIEEGCGKKFHANGYCSMHLSRIQRYGDPNVVKRTYSKQPKFCTVKGCENKTHGHGYCQKHYRRFKRHGDPNGVNH